MQPPPDDREFAQLDQNRTALHHQQLALAVPPAREALDPGLVQLLGQTTQRTISKLSGGQLDLPFEAGPEVPPSLAAAVLGLQQFTGEPMAEQLTSNEGLKYLIGKVSMIGDANGEMQPGERR